MSNSSKLDLLHKMFWAKDEEVHDCTTCKKNFGLLFRRHHCRTCGQIFCHQCCKTEVEYEDGKKHRTCRACLPSDAMNVFQPTHLSPSFSGSNKSFVSNASSCAFDFPLPLVPIRDSDQVFPVRRIYALAFNYDAKKDANGVSALQPGIFMKPADAIVVVPSPDAIVKVALPPSTEELNHEVEMVIAIGPAASRVPNVSTIENAEKIIYGYATGLDMTRRAMFGELRKDNRPWDMAKGFDRSAPIGPITLRDQVNRSLETAFLRLYVNGELKQDGTMDKLVWGPHQALIELSKLTKLEQGDLIFMGTPDNVGPVRAGDVVEATVEHLGTLKVEFVRST